MKKHIILLLVLVCTLWLGGPVSAAIFVGRISHVEGRIYRYMDVDRSWVETYVQSPVGTLDVLTTGDDSRAEIAFPHNLMVRLDQNAEIEILNLEEDGSNFALQTGLARFYNRTAATSLTVESKLGTVQVEPGAAADVQVGEKSIVVSAIYGNSTFRSVENGVERLELLTGSTSLEFKAGAVTAWRTPPNREWALWCAGREDIWDQNRLLRSAYLPESMQEYAGVLEPNGSWNRIYYRGYNYWAWKPRHVAVDWSPYTTGYWYDWHGSPVWIDQNTWGWVTHHHGHWIKTQSAWMWTPYVHVADVPGVTVIGFNISFGKTYRPHWHPGRVRWITHADSIGWLPLAPWETFYGRRNWGPRTVVVNRRAGFSIGVNLAHHSYIDHAVIIPKRYFQQRRSVTVNNYNTVKIKNINKTRIIKNYKQVQILEDQQHRKYTPNIKRTDRMDNRVVGSPARGAVIKNGVRPPENFTGIRGSAKRAETSGPKERLSSSGLRNFANKSQDATRQRRMKITTGEKEYIPLRASEKRAKINRGMVNKNTNISKVDAADRTPVQSPEVKRAERRPQRAAKKSPGAIAKKSAVATPGIIQKKGAGPGSGIGMLKSVTPGKTAAARRTVSPDRRQNFREASENLREKGFRPVSAVRQTGGKTGDRRGKTVSAGRQNNSQKTGHVRQKGGLPQTQAQDNREPGRRMFKSSNQNYASEQERKTVKQKKRTPGVQNNAGGNTSGARFGNRQRPGGDKVSASVHNLRIR